MNLRTKILLIISATMLAMVVIMFMTTWFITSGGLPAAESQNTGVNQELQPYLEVSLLVIGLIFGGLVIWLLENQILSHLESLSTQIRQIGRGGDLTKRLNFIGKGELAELAHTINWTLDTIQRSQDQLRESEERFRSLVENAPDVIYTLAFNEDGKSVITSLNPAFEKITGWPREQWLGSPMEALLHPDDIPQAMNITAQLQTGFTPPLYDLHVQTASGDYLVGEFVTSPLFNGGKIASAVGIARNITEIRRSEERLYKMNACFLSFGTDPLDNITKLTELTGQLMGASAAYYNRLDHGLLSSWGQWNSPAGYNPEDTPDGHLCYDVIKQTTDELVLVRHLPQTDYHDSDPNVTRYRLQTYIGKPVSLADTHVGSLCCVYQRDHIPSQEEINLFEIIAAAMSIEEKRLWSEKIREALYKISQATNSTADLSDLYTTIHSILGELIPADNLYIALYDPTDDLVSFPYFVDHYDEKPIPQKAGKGLTEYVIHTGQPLLATPEVCADLLQQGLITDLGTPSVDWLGVPLKTMDGTIGVLAIQSYDENKRLGIPEKDLIWFVSYQVAMAITHKRAEVSRVALLKAIPDSILRMRRDGTFLDYYSNDPAQPVISNGDLLGKKVDDLLPPEFSQMIMGFIEKTLQTGQTQIFEYHPPGMETDRYMEGRMVACGPEEVITISRDITERKQAEAALLHHIQEMTALYETSLEINAHSDLTELLNAIVRRSANLLGARMGGLYLLKPDEQCLELVVNYNLPHDFSSTTLHLGEGVSGQVAQEGQPIMVEDYQNWAGRVDVFSNQPFRRVLGVPLKVEDHLLGVINITDDQKTCPFNEHEIRLVSLFADQAAIALENLRLYESIQQELAERKSAEQALRESEDKYRQLFTAESDALIVVDAQTRQIYDANDAALLLYGYSRQEFLGIKADIPTNGDRNDQHGQWMDHTGIQAAPIQEHRKKDGTLIPVEISTSSFMLGDRKMVIAAIRDITERVRAEEALRHQTGRAEALLRVAERLNARLAMETVLKVVCEETVQALNVPAASVDLYDYKKEHLYHAAGLGLPLSYQQRHVPVPVTVYKEFSRGSRLAILYPHEDQFTEWPNSTLYNDIYVQMVVSNLMQREGTLVGALNIFTFHENRSLTEDETALLTGLSDLAAQAIVNARLFEEAQYNLKRLQALRNIDISISASFDLKVTLYVILDQVIAQLSIDAADVLLLKPQTLTLEFAAGRGLRTNALKHTHLRLGEGTAGVAALERRTIHISDLGTTPQEFTRSPNLTDEGFVAYFGVPLTAKGQVVGVMEIFNRSPLEPEPEWLEFMEALATQTAIAIDNAKLFEGLQRSNIDLTLAYDTTLEGWSNALELRDRETKGHSQRVTEMTVRLAREMGMSNEELVHVRRGALLHDIGKMGIPDSILHKPAPLDEDDWSIMRQHPRYAYDLLSNISFLIPAFDIPYCHHEKWDGTGYPRGLRGEQIPLAARIFAIVDVWDALLSDRPYREAWEEETVYAYLHQQSGKQFDPHVVDTFFRIIQDKDS
jgi:PAS domain S-box-containing protein